MKTQRLLQFLMGLSNPEIARALRRFGFEQATMDEGWALLRRAATARLDARPIVTATGEQVAQIDAWENQWFPVTSAVLQRHHPEVHATVFHNLGQTQGDEVVLSVSTLVTRLEALAGSPALATLARHGLTEEVLGEAHTLLDRVMQPLAAPPGAEDDEPVDPAAEAAMWSYYLQWSAIARSAITDRRLLRKLGFLRKQRGGEEETPVDQTPVTPVTPVAPVGGIPAAEPPAAAGGSTRRA